MLCGSFTKITLDWKHQANPATTMLKELQDYLYSCGKRAITGDTQMLHYALRFWPTGDVRAHNTGYTP